MRNLLLLAVMISGVSFAQDVRNKTLPLGKQINFGNMFVCGSEKVATALATARNEEGDEAFQILAMRALRDGVCGVFDGIVTYEKQIGTGTWRVFQIKNYYGQTFWEISDWKLETI